MLADENIFDYNEDEETTNVLHLLSDNLHSIRDIIDYDETTGESTNVNSISYGAFGTIIVQTNPTITTIYGYTSQETDPESEFMHYDARPYDPYLQVFASMDPLGFAANDINLYRYVGNSPTNFVDPSGLGEFNPMAWHWHHMLPSEVFNSDLYFLYPDLVGNINMRQSQAEYGWMMRGGDHLTKNGIHVEGWNGDWKDWIKVMKKNDIPITKEAIDTKLERMKLKYNLLDRGFPAKYSYNERQLAWKVADQMSRLKAATISGKVKFFGSAGSGIVRKLDDVDVPIKRTPVSSPKLRGPGGKLFGGLIGTLIGLGVEIGFAEEGESVDGHDLFFGWLMMGDSALNMGSEIRETSEADRERLEQEVYIGYMQHQIEMTRMDFYRDVINAFLNIQIVRPIPRNLNDLDSQPPLQRWLQDHETEEE